MLWGGVREGERRNDSREPASAASSLDHACVGETIVISWNYMTAVSWRFFFLLQSFLLSFVIGIIICVKGYSKYSSRNNEITSSRNDVVISFTESFLSRE